MIQARRALRDVYRYPVPQEGRYGKLRLDKNENTVGYPASVIQEMLEGVSSDFLSAYPEPHSLYRKIAKWNGVGVENVLLAPGSEMAIRYLFEAFLEPGDQLLILNPSFAMFEVYGKICGARTVTEDYDRRFRISVASLLDKISKRTKIVAIANPNNPTGTVITQPDLLRIAQKAAKCGALVLVDEAYFYFYMETMLPYCREMENLVVTRTFSKACGLAGLRLGYAIANPSIIKEMMKLQPIDHANCFAVKLAEYVIDHEELIWAHVNEIVEGREFLVRELAKLGVKVVDGLANFVLFDARRRKDEVVARLRQHDILVGANLRLPFEAGYVRVAVGPVSQMRRFIEVLRTILRDRRSARRHRRERK
jgi:histidinol-phosphate aminotransferase